MEPLTPAAIAVATLFFTKTVEKTGEKLGEAISSQVSRLVQLIRRTPLPKTELIEQGDQPVDFEQAVVEIESAATTDPELARVVDQLAAIVKADPALLQKVQNTAQAINQEPTLIQNNAKLAEKIGLLVQGGTVSIENFTI